jgi:hypothetical protein
VLGVRHSYRSAVGPWPTDCRVRSFAEREALPGQTLGSTSDVTEPLRRPAAHDRSASDRPRRGHRRLDVPAISLASAVPAFAGSGCCDLSVAGLAHWRNGGLNYIDVPLDIANACSTSVSGLTVTVIICGIEDITYTGTDFLPPGWTQAGKANKQLTADEDGCYTLTYLSVGPLAGQSATHPQLTVKTMAYTGTGNHRPAGSVTVLVSSAGCSAAPLPLTIAAVG